MIEKTDTVLALLEGHPERWTTGAFARTDTGENMWDANDEKAACFCLSGAIERVYGSRSFGGDESIWNQLLKFLRENLGWKEQSVARWNDAGGRTFDEVIAAVRGAGI